MKLKTRSIPNKIKPKLHKNDNKSLYMENYALYNEQIDKLFFKHAIDRSDKFNYEIKVASKVNKKMQDADFASQYNPPVGNTKQNEELRDEVNSCNFDKKTADYILSYMTQELENQKKILSLQSQKKSVKSKILKLLKLKNPLKNIAQTSKKIISHTKAIVGSILGGAVLMTALASTPGDQDNQQVLPDDISHNTIKSSLTIQNKSVESSTLPELQTPVSIPNREPVPVLIDPTIESSEHADEVQEITPKNKYQILLDDIQPGEGLWKSAERAKKLFGMKKSNKIDLQKLLKFSLSEGHVTQTTMTKEFQAKTLIKYLILNKHIKY